ncbi:hypothetical protein GCM10022222_67470 [Amycolatopsis ultiminotia]|uniref:Uncharacterized protein n=1 Tax=Amycolatopsis ultiminotia TaxID=543629 RepID=A0ABP6XWD2_9PSEU
MALFCSLVKSLRPRRPTKGDAVQLGVGDTALAGKPRRDGLRCSGEVDPTVRVTPETILREVS